MGSGLSLRKTPRPLRGGGWAFARSRGWGGSRCLAGPSAGGELERLFHPVGLVDLVLVRAMAVSGATAALLVARRIPTLVGDCCAGGSSGLASVPGLEHRHGLAARPLWRACRLWRPAASVPGNPTIAAQRGSGRGVLGVVSIRAPQSPPGSLLGPGSERLRFAPPNKAMNGDEGQLNRLALLGGPPTRALEILWARHSFSLLVACRAGLHPVIAGALGRRIQ